MQTMVAALRGRRNADKLRSRRDLLLAYHSGAFAGAAFNGKLKPFDHYARNVESGDGQQLQHANAIAFFHRLKAKGVPVEITRTVN
jgi:hypothetical protein